MKTCSETYQFEKDLKWENPAPGVNRQIMAYDGQLMMVKVKFDKGAVGSMHEHIPQGDFGADVSRRFHGRRAAMPKVRIFFAKRTRPLRYCPSRPCRRRNVPAMWTGTQDKFKGG